MKSVKGELENLKLILKVIAGQFGDKCEVVLHDWSNEYKHSIIAIENGHVTGRKTGDSGTNLGLEVMRGTVHDGNRFGYTTRAKNGKILKSSTIYLKNDENMPIGALCINFDITDLLLSKAMYDTFAVASQSENEIFANDVNEVLQFLINESIHLTGKTVEEMTKSDKLAAIKYLEEKGAFLITRAGGKICKAFGISKFTLYNYLDEIRGGSQATTD